MNLCSANQTSRALALLLFASIVPVVSRAEIIHRWSFNETEGTTLSDSIGGADGEIIGDDWELGEGQLRLFGGASDIAAYVDLPNGIISGLTDATAEGWITVEGAQSWARVFDFGSTDAAASEGGELFEPGDGANGQDYWMLSVSRGTNNDQQRHELRNRDPEFGGDDEGVVGDQQQILDTDILTDLDEEYHFAAVYDSSGPELRTYRDGELEGTMPVTIELGNLNDVNNWLGRSNWVNDAGFEGTYNEFRLYDEALDDDAVAASFNAGPDAPLGGGPTQLQAGDSDQDLDFDQLDIVAVSITARYLTGQAATWGEGDWNGAPGGSQGSPPAGNGFFDQGDIIAALQHGFYLTGPYAALAPTPGDSNDEQTSLVYDASTGGLSVNAPASTELTSINVTSDGSLFIGDKPAVLDGAFDNFAADNIFKATFGGSFGSIEFGQVLPGGLSREAVVADLSAVGSLAGGGELGDVDLIYIPEPSAVVFLVLGLFLCGYRWCRRTSGSRS